ncbi:MAG TPA: di-heme oxidoredictase family protein [Isosphaeraceae bacterium]
MNADAPPDGGEWRTPSLWGLRDTGPYLHDGRARTVEEAVALHGGEAEEVVKHYFALTASQRLEIDSFLATLAAPAAGPEPPRAEAVARPKGPGAAWVERQLARHDRGVRAEVVQVVEARRSAVHPLGGPRPADRPPARRGRRTPAVATRAPRA